MSETSPRVTLPVPVLRSPLHGLGLADSMAPPQQHNRVWLSEFAHLACLVLRGAAGDAQFMQAAAGVLGAPLPSAPMTLLPTAAALVLWLSPDEWLLVCRRSRRADLVCRLSAALGSAFAQIVDNSGGLGLLRIAGPDHLLLLRQLGPYDFDSLAALRCVATVMSKTAVVVARSDSAGVVLIVRRSYADYLWRLLWRTAQPYQPCVCAPALCADPLFAPLLESS